MKTPLWQHSGVFCLLIRLEVRCHENRLSLESAFPDWN